MSALRTVPVTMPETVWGQLASIADSQGVKVADVIALAVAARIRDVQVVDQLAVLQAGLDEARAAGWKAPRRGRARTRAERKQA